MNNTNRQVMVNKTRHRKLSNGNRGWTRVLSERSAAPVPKVAPVSILLLKVMKETRSTGLWLRHSDYIRGHLWHIQWNRNIDMMKRAKFRDIEYAILEHKTTVKNVVLYSFETLVNCIYKKHVHLKYWWYCQLCTEWHCMLCFSYYTTSVAWG